MHTVLRHILRALAVGLALVGLSACGQQSQATLDCEEYDRMMDHVIAGAQNPMVPSRIAACETHLEAASTRCQGAFRALAECSRQCDSKPSFADGVCISEYSEQVASCTQPPAR